LFALGDGVLALLDDEVETLDVEIELVIMPVELEPPDVVATLLGSVVAAVALPIQIVKLLQLE
jgi:hypothetical protein